MTDVAADFEAAASALLAENAALRAQVDAYAPRTAQYIGGLSYLGDLNNVELCAAPGSIQRFSQQSSGSPTDIGTLLNVNIEGDWTNVYAHDLHGLGWWKAYQIGAAHLGGTLHGCLLKDIGWLAVDKGHGHTLYAQGYADAPKHMSASILVKSFSDYNLHFYGSAASVLEGLHCQQSVFLGGIALIGGGAPLRDVTVDDCFFAKCVPQLGYSTPNNHEITITNSVLGGFLWSQPFEYVTFRGNHVISDSDGGIFTLPFPFQEAWRTDWDVDYNTYYSNSIRPFSSPQWGGMTLAQWQANTGFDLHSVVLPTPTTPTVRVYPVNAGRHVCNVAIYNRPLQASVTVHLPLITGGWYELRQVQDYAHDVRPFVYDGIGLEVALSGSYALPDGVTTPLPTLVGNLTPKYAVFEVWER